MYPLKTPWKAKHISLHKEQQECSCIPCSSQAGLFAPLYYAEVQALLSVLSAWEQNLPPSPVPDARLFLQD